MSEIRDLLDADTRAKLAQVVSEQKDDAPAYVIIKASTDPNPPRTLTAADAIEIDPESEAMIDAECVDCHVPMLIDPKLPEDAAPEDKDKPRVPLCKACGKVRARFAAINEQRNVEVIQRRTRVAQRRPRITDGIDHPVTVTTEKENEMNLDNVPDAVVGAAAKEALRAEIAASLPGRRKKAKDKQAKAEKQAKDNVKKRQAERKGLVLAEFNVGTSLVVPALDLTEVEDLNEMVSTTLRSPYNKARFRLAGERPLWAPKDEDEDGYVPTTYQTLIDEHGRLMALALAKAAEKAKPKPKGKAKPQIVAVLDDEQEAVIKSKTKALAKLTGVDKKQARAIVMAGMGL
jgi:hypothetical protein